MAEKVKQCGECGIMAFEFEIGAHCPVMDAGCQGLVVEVVTPDPPEKKRTRQTNPLRWARYLTEEESPRKLVEKHLHLVDTPTCFGPEFKTPTEARNWLMSGNTDPGWVHELHRISERGITVKETRQLQLIQKGDSGDYVTIGKVEL